jgi:hypothetical protein
VAGLEDHARRHGVDLRAGCAAPSANGVALDRQGNIVVVNIGNDEVLTFSPAGQLTKTEHAAQAGNDGLVIMADGDEVREQRRERRCLAHPRRQAAELIARNIPSAASMC